MEKRLLSWQREAQQKEQPPTRQEFDEIVQAVERITSRLEEYIRKNGKETK